MKINNQPVIKNVTKICTLYEENQVRHKCPDLHKIRTTFSM